MPQHYEFPGRDQGYRSSIEDISVPTSCTGTIIETTDEGNYLAQMTGPSICVLVLLACDRRVTTGYPNVGARTRVTNHRSPDEIVSTGAKIVAHVARITEETGKTLQVYSSEYPFVHRYREYVTTGSFATRWGVVS